MTETKKKELYLGKSMKDLNHLAEEKNVKRIAEGKCRMYLKSAEKLYDKAKLLEVEGDEEKGYVLYMTFLSICTAIRKTQEYKKSKNYYDALVMKNMLKAMETAESMASNLKKRYEEKEALEVSSRLDRIDMDNSKPSEKDKEDKPEVIGPPDETKKEPEEKKLGTSEGLISVSSLYGLLTDGSTSVLLLDVRAQQDFDASHIMYKSCINVPPTAAKPGCLSMHIEANLSGGSKEAWQSRGRVDFVVMVDWHSLPEAFRPSSTVKSLKDAIFKWEQEVVVKSEPLLLEGGYTEWLNVYPTMCTNPHVNAPASHATTTPTTVTLDQISYDLDMGFLKPPEEKTLPPQHPLQNGGVPDSNLQHGVNNKTIPMIPDRSLKHATLNGPLANNKIPNANANSSLADSGYPIGHAAPIKRLNNDLKAANTQAKNLADLRRQLEDGGAENRSSDVVASATKTVPAASAPPKAPIPNRTLKPHQNKVDKPTSNEESPFMAEKQRIEEEKRKLEREREEWNLKMQAEREQYDRLREMKMKEAKETADIMRMKRQLEGSITKVKPDDAKAEKARLERLKKEEEEEEERSRVAEQRLQAELDAEQKKKQLEEQRKKLEAQEREIEAKLKQEEAKRAEIKRIRDEKERKAREQQEAKEREEEEKERKLFEQKHREIELERQRLDKEEREAAILAEKMRAEVAHKDKLERERQERLTQERFEKERMARELKEKALKEQHEREQLEKERREHAERERLQREKMEREKAEQMRLERQKKEEEARNAAHAASNTPLPAGWERGFDTEKKRSFYINQVTRDTQWEIPTTPATLVSANKPRAADSTGSVYKTRLRDEADVAASGGGGLKRSYSSPNIAKMMVDEASRKVSPFPSVDRTAKPKISDSSQVQVQPRSKIRNFDGVWGSVGSGLTGLKNMGNTCYMNSTLQCLSNTAFLTTYLITDCYVPHINRENKMGSGGYVAEEFAALIKQLWSAQYRSITPRDFKYSVARQNSMFAGNDQQDSQEFLLTLLDSLHEDMNKIRKRPKIPEQKNDGVDEVLAGEEAWRMHKTVHDSVIVDLFQGQYKSTVMCKTCEKKSVTFDTFMYLSLDIPSQNRCSLDECLRNFSKEEKMTGDSRWNCPACRVKRDAVKRIVIWKLPPIVIIVLKRFYYKGMWRQKINAHIDYPLEGLELNRYISGPRVRKPYDLFAISNHYGTMEGGHYTAFCKSPKLNKWFKYDDHEVYEISKSSIKSPAAYSLFYTSMGNMFN